MLHYLRLRPYGQFQSTLPARGATGNRRRVAALDLFQSTLPARGATPFIHHHRKDGIDFNPRSPHGERPVPGAGSAARKSHFNPRSPHGERLNRFGNCPRINAFQSTLPARGATTSVESLAMNIIFQSTLPARGATRIEIHALVTLGYFNPRSPHGERRNRKPVLLLSHLFQSTLPARGATKSDIFLYLPIRFQSTLPARGATKYAGISKNWRGSFQSTLPARGATDAIIDYQSAGFTISIHAPRTGSDLLSAE